MKFKKTINPIITTAMIVGMLFSSFQNIEETTFPLTVKVADLRNSKGVVQFALYRDEDSFPDEQYKKYYRKIVSKIVSGASTVTFENLPVGRYAISILHDEDGDGKIKKGIILPKEGIGFSNYQSIGFSNRPTFKKASFDLYSNKDLNVRIIYML